jgi:uncharacterized membrane protein YsdA (DUF1294 family)
MKDPS